MEEEVLNYSQEFIEEIKAKVAELRKADPKLKQIFPIVIEGSEYDAKERYVGYFRQPSFAIFSKYLTAAQNNQAVATRQLARDCFIDGDKDILEDDSLFLFGLMGQISKIIEMRSGTLVNFSKAGK